MAAKQGKVFSGEDDESDEEEEEYEPPSWATAPSSKPVAAPVAFNTLVSPSVRKDDALPDAIGSTNEGSPEDEEAAMLSSEPKHIDTAPLPTSIPVYQAPASSPQDVPSPPDDVWTATLNGEWPEDAGKNKMAMAGASHLHSVLESTLHQITELAESQEHLLSVVAERNVHLMGHPDLMVVEQTMSQLPSYFQKVLQLKLKMNDITMTLEKLKGRADHLQVEAQSRALAMEERKEKQSQWQRLVQLSKPNASTDHASQSNASS